MAATHNLSVTVRGSGGHGSLPHLAHDPLTAAAEMVTALQTMVTRRFDVFDPVVPTVGLFRAGTKAGTIPDTAYFEAALRSFSARTAARLRSETTRLCEAIAAAHGVRVGAEFEDGSPVTRNDPSQFDVAAGVVAGVLGADRFPRHGVPGPRIGGLLPGT